MSLLPGLFILCVHFSLISGYVLVGENDKIVWPDEYHIQGEQIYFDRKIKTPFEMWYSAKKSCSRIDYYGGINQQFIKYNGSAHEKFKIFPALLYTNQKMCFNVTEANLENLMPYAADFIFSGKTIMYDKILNIWTYTQSIMEQKIRVDFLYVFKTEHGFDMPALYIQRETSLLRGSMTYTLLQRYYNFDTTVNDEDFVIKEDLEEADVCFTQNGTIPELERLLDFKKDVQTIHPDIPMAKDIVFDSYANYYDKTYLNHEKEMRKNILEQNWRMVQEHNSKNLSYKLELNEFSDKTEEELKYLSGTTFVSGDYNMSDAVPALYTPEEIDAIAETLPESFDLRLEGAISSVKNQGSCGSCAAFTATALVEGALARKNGYRLLDLSEQSVIDCAWISGNKGCKKGSMRSALYYVQYIGIPTEREYGSYMQMDGVCNIQNMTETYSIKDYDCRAISANELKFALIKYGPVGVNICVSDKFLQYSRGVFSSNSKCVEPDHGVTVVGYGTSDGEDYWIVKNSWGDKWGEGGYIRISAENYDCDMSIISQSTYACYVIV